MFPVPTVVHYIEKKPGDFVYLKEYVPTVQEDIRYYTEHNFIGHPIPGYRAPVCLLTKQAAAALGKVQQALSKQHLGLLVFDGYRPQMAVEAFYQWSLDPKDQSMKRDYYPRIEKAELFKLGYIARFSGHTRGSTVDLTLVDLHTHQPLDMGTPFDFMDVRSHPDCREITREQFQHRMLLRKTMLKLGFEPLETEWWHFTLKDEPYKNQYFNFPVDR